MSLTALLFLLQSAPADRVTVTVAMPETVVTDAGSLTLRPGHKVVGEHVSALYATSYDSAVNYLSNDVENVVSDLSSHLHFPKGRQVALASYLSMTKKGKFPLKSVYCQPDVAESVDVTRCELRFGKKNKIRRFTVRYFVGNGEIVKIYSWAVNGGKLMTDG